MANPSKQKGTRAETNVARYLTAHGLRTARRPLAGSADQGDLHTTMPNGMEVTVEVKAGKQTQHYTRSQLEEWKRQTIVEHGNSGSNMCMLVIVRYRRNMESAEVWLPNFQWFGETMPGWTMLYLDEFSDMLWATS